MQQKNVQEPELVTHASQLNVADSVFIGSEASSFKTQKKEPSKSSGRTANKFALPKMIVTEEDKKMLKRSKEIIQRAQDFKIQAKSFSVVIVQEVDESFEQDEAVNLVNKFVNALDRIMRADTPSEKHQNEVDAIDQITRDIPDLSGEKCRDFLKHFSNLRKNFNDLVKVSNTLHQTTEKRFESIKITQKEQNYLIDQEKARADKMQAVTTVRNSEIKLLRSQIQNLLDVVNRKTDIQASIQSQKSLDTPYKGVDSSSVVQMSEKIIDELRMSSESEHFKDIVPQMQSLKQEIVEILKFRTDQRAEIDEKTDLLNSYAKNCSFLEDKISELMTEKEEQSINLKSQIVIFKQKAKGYKQKLKVELEDFKKNSLLNEKKITYKEIQKQEVELNMLRNNLITAQKGNEESLNRIEAIQERLKITEENFKEQMDQKELNIQSLTEQLDQISRTHQLKISEEGMRRTEISNKMNTKQQEETLKELRIDFLLNNQKKQQLQKKFLEQQLEKDVKQLQIHMNKTELELKKDQLINSSLALSRLQMLHKTMSDSLKYMRKVVGFMVFDQEGQGQRDYSSLDDDASIAQIKREMSQEMENNKNASQNDMDDESDKSVENNTVDNFQANNNHEQSTPMPIDRLVKMHQFELIEILLTWLQESFNKSRTPISHDLSQAIQIAKAKSDPQKVTEIKRNFAADSRIHNAQFNFKLNEKIQALEAERQILHSQLQQQQQQITELQDQSKLAESPTIVKEAKPVIVSFLQRTKEIDLVEEEHVKPLTDIILLQRENAALKNRIKEVRLVFNKQVNDIQDTLKMTKSSLENDMTQLKVRYGKDLTRLHKDYELNSSTLRQQIEMETRKELQSYKDKSEAAHKNENFKNSEEKNLLLRQIEEEKQTKEEYFLELQKLKQESSYLYQGGFGTFTLAFENPIYPKMVDKQKQLDTHRQNVENFKQSLKGKRRSKVISAKQEEVDAELAFEVSSLEKQLDAVEIQPLEKLCHFIEVGFQIAQKNFQALQIYNELTYDSMARKYLFEFQMPLNDLDVKRLENKLRTQISDNFALFNEISPLFVSLNLGRPVNQMSHDCIDIEKFRIIDRKSLQVNGHYLSVNFLKCDLPLRMIRIVAFNSLTCQNFQIDLTYEDLLILAEGHIKMLEEESIQDLTTLLLNSLTVIKRKVKVQTTTVTSVDKKKEKDERTENLAKPKFQMIEVLVVEHRCFFNEIYRTNWDQRKKMILARHDKRKQGIVKDIGTLTDFEKSLMYEEFSAVYQADFFLALQPKDLADHFSLQVQRGNRSGNIKMEVKQTNASLRQTLYLFNSDMKEEGKTNNLTSALLQPIRADEDQLDPDLALCYVVSLEKVFGREEILIVRMTSIQRKFADMMIKFNWDGQNGPQQDATTFTSEIFYLVRKVGEPFEYYRAKDYEILNTEARAQLFSHSFGYSQKQADFGMKIQASLPDVEDDKVDTDPDQNNDEKLKIVVLDQNKGFNLKVPNKLAPFKGNETLIIRQFVIMRLKLIASSDTKKHGFMPIYESHYAFVSLLANPTMIKEGQIKVIASLSQLNLEIEQVTDVRGMIPDVLDRNQLYDTLKFKLSNLLFEHLVIERQDDGNQLIYFDKDIEPISSQIQSLRQKRFDELMIKSNSEQIQLQFSDPAQLKLSKPELLDCQKCQENAIIGQRQFKVTCYFVKNLKNVNVLGQTQFDWKVLYIDAYLPAKDQTITIVFTEKDLKQLVEMLREVTMHQNKGEDKIDLDKIFHSQMSQQDLLYLALDLITFDSQNNCLKLSFPNFKVRVQERRKLEVQFLEAGGRYIRKSAESPNEEYEGFETSIPKTEISKQLIVSVEKDFSDSKVDINVYLCKMRSLPDYQKLSFEVFSLEEPNLIFRCDYISSAKQNGQQVLIERFNLLEQYIAESQKQLTSEAEGEVRNKGLVLSVSEQAFPHDFHFMLLEPCSHIFWSYQYSDDCLNHMERRRDKQAFTYMLLKSCQDGILRNLSHSTTDLVETGYQMQQQQPKPHTLIANNDVLEAITYNSEDLNFVYGKTFEMVEGVYREVRVYFSDEARKLVVCSSQVENMPTHNLDENSRADDLQSYVQSEVEIQLLLLKQKESSRYFQGILVGGPNPLIYQIEQSVGMNRQTDRVLRIHVMKINGEEEFETMIDVTISDPYLFTTVPIVANQRKRFDNLLLPDFEVKEEKRYHLNTGYRDTFGCLPKMDDLATDIANCEAEKLSSLPKLQTAPSTWEMIYRTVKHDHANHFVLSVLGERTPQIQDDEAITSTDTFDIRKKLTFITSKQPETFEKIKINLFETNSGAQEVFLFQPTDIISLDELSQIRGKPSQTNQVYKEALDLRLRVKLLETEQIGVINEERKYVVFFVNPSLLRKTIAFDGEGKRQNQLFAEIDIFDIRKNRQAGLKIGKENSAASASSWKKK